MVNSDDGTRQPDALWKIEDVAKHLAVTVPTVRNHIKTRGLPFKRVGGSLRFRPEEVTAWVDEQAA